MNIHQKFLSLEVWLLCTGMLISP